jgi:hypothetical protein
LSRLSAEVAALKGPPWRLAGAGKAGKTRTLRWFPKLAQRHSDGLAEPALGKWPESFRTRKLSMKKFDDRTAANLDVVLDSVCRTLPNSGGDHESRKFVAEKMLRAAQRGKRTLGALEAVARRALQSLSRGCTS